MLKRKESKKRWLWVICFLLLIPGVMMCNDEYTQAFHDLMNELFDIDEDGKFIQNEDAWGIPYEFPIHLSKHRDGYLKSTDGYFQGYYVYYWLSTEELAIEDPWTPALLNVIATPDHYETDGNQLNIIFKNPVIYSSKTFDVVETLPLMPNDQLTVQVRDCYHEYYGWNFPPNDGFAVFDGEEEIWSFSDYHAGIRNITLDHGTIYGFVSADGGHGFFNRGEFTTYLYVTEDHWQFFGGRGTGHLTDINGDGEEEMIVYMPFWGIGVPGHSCYVVYEIYWFDGQQYLLTQTPEQRDAISEFADREIIQGIIADNRSDWNTDILEWIHFQIYAGKTKDDILQLLEQHFPGEALSIDGWMIDYQSYDKDKEKPLEIEWVIDTCFDGREKLDTMW